MNLSIVPTRNIVDQRRQEVVLVGGGVILLQNRSIVGADCVPARRLLPTMAQSAPSKVIRLKQILAAIDKLDRVSVFGRERWREEG